MTRAPLRGLAAAVLALMVGVLAACSNDGPSTSDAAGGIKVPEQTLVFPNASGRPTSAVLPTAAPREPRPTSAPGESTTTGASVASVAPPTEPTTTVVKGICELEAVIQDIGPADAGYVFADLHCVGPWGTVVARALDPNVSTDELIVMRADDEGLWSVVAGGGDTTCTSAGIPPELFGALACGRWETG